MCATLTGYDRSIVRLTCLDTNARNINECWTSAIYKIQHTFPGLALKLNMQTNYKNSWEKFIHDGAENGKLRTYSKFKTLFKLENYILQFPLSQRRNLTKLRISAHHLAIETGRYAQPKIPIDKRICFHCGKIEDELHFIFHCTLYDEERNVLAKSLSDFTNISLVQSDQTFCTLMSCMEGDLEVGEVLCNYINSCFEKRALILSEIKEKEIYLRPKSTITSSGRLSKRPIILDL